MHKAGEGDDERNKEGGVEGRGVKGLEGDGGLELPSEITTKEEEREEEAATGVLGGEEKEKNILSCVCFAVLTVERTVGVSRYGSSKEKRY